MKTIIFILISLFAFSMISSFAQGPPLILDHPGTFKLINWNVYSNYDCGFTKAETTANYQKIIRVTDLVRKNPVFIDQKGFECVTYVVCEECPDKFGYGIPSLIRFGFGDWYMYKGQPVYYNIEPPSWSIIVNTLDRAFDGDFIPGASKPTTKPKEGFNYEKWKNVSDKLQDCRYIPGEKEELGNGIDRYGSETIILYNPERPPYYLPVKFRELAEWLIEYWKLHPQELQSDLMTQMIEAEYALIPESERDGWAYKNTYDDRCPFLKITPVPGPRPVVRLNPEYWNKKLPRSAIQILNFSRLTDTNLYTEGIKECLKLNAPGYSLNRFLEAFDITTLVPAIDR